VDILSLEKGGRRGRVKTRKSSRHMYGHHFCEKRARGSLQEGRTKVSVWSGCLIGSQRTLVGLKVDGWTRGGEPPKTYRLETLKKSRRPPAEEDD